MSELRRNLVDRAHILYRVIAFGAILCITAVRFAGRLVWSRLTWRRNSWQSSLGQSLAELCEALGTTYIKLGQLLSTRYDIIPAAILKPLERLQDQVAPFNPLRVPAILAEQLRRDPAEVFASFAPRPISSASVACVYRAVLHTGQTVAVKIRRPGIVRTVRTDLQLMNWCARMLVRLPGLQAIPMPEVIEELGGCIEQQLDFRREAANSRRFRASFAHQDQIHMPALMDEYTTDALLVMEFMPDLVRINELVEQGAEYRSAIVTALKALYHMIFVDGFIHCDMHPGNMYFQDGGHVTLLDTGFVKELNQDERFLFAKFFYGIVDNRGPQCARIIYDTALSVPAEFAYQEFEQAISALIAQTAGVRANKFQVAGFAMKLFDLQRRFGLRGAPNFIMAILALLVFEGIIKTYYGELDFQRAAQPFLLKALFPPRPHFTRRTANPSGVESTAPAVIMQK